MPSAARVLAFRKRIQANNETLFPATIRIGASVIELAASTGGLKKSLDLEFGGQEPKQEITFRVSKALLVEEEIAPEENQAILWVEREQIFRLKKIVDAGDTAAAVALECQEEGA